MIHEPATYLFLLILAALMGLISGSVLMGIRRDHESMLARERGRSSLRALQYLEAHASATKMLRYALYAAFAFAAFGGAGLWSVH